MTAREIGRDRADSYSVAERRGKHTGEQSRERKEGKTTRLDIRLDALLDEQEDYLIYMCAALSASSMFV